MCNTDRKAYGENSRWTNNSIQNLTSWHVAKYICQFLVWIQSSLINWFRHFLEPSPWDRWYWTRSSNLQRKLFWQYRYMTTIKDDPISSPITRIMLLTTGEIKCVTEMWYTNFFVFMSIDMHKVVVEMHRSVSVPILMNRRFKHWSFINNRFGNIKQFKQRDINIGNRVIKGHTRIYILQTRWGRYQ